MSLSPRRRRRSYHRCGPLVHVGSRRRWVLTGLLSVSGDCASPRARLGFGDVTASVKRRLWPSPPASCWEGRTGLFPVSIRQALFIAPCSHTFHYKCLRPLLEAHHPAFR
ncbi:hypothetical protein FB45DRAFT_938484 [Roridomyces roridus]|uniref:RING-type domain-containing protein n=1 Tax=Roridomyces roridus TaxID=1738132 RepID=A0AAD7FB83_9AGAR|nr:hypothetical protein FB45DRAFT_938484 [Roridomyces roridus]